MTPGGRQRASGADPAGTPEVLVGGQAVLEGVMMKMPRSWAVTVRRADGSLVSREGDFAPWSDRWPVLKLPILRGPAILGQMMQLGMRSLFFATDVLAADEKAAGRTASAAKTTLTLGSLLVLQAVADGPDGTEADADPADRAVVVRREPETEPVLEKGIGKSELAFSLILALALFIGVFKALPLGIALLAGRFFPALSTPLAESLISGLALAGVFIGYLALLSRFPDMRRMFMYHGAEHEMVHVHEKGLPWTPAHAAAQSTRHPRCGTSFLFFVVLTSIVVWSLFPIQAGFLAKIGLRLALLPVVMGLSFELIRLSSRHRGNPFFRALMAPGLWSQGITTKKPDDSMREVSIRSLELASARHAG